MKLKKIASLMLAGIMAVSMLAACGEGKGNDSSSSSSSEVPATGISAKIDGMLKNKDLVELTDNSTYQTWLTASIGKVDYKNTALPTEGWQNTGDVVSYLKDNFGKNVVGYVNSSFDTTWPTISLTNDGVYAGLYYIGGSVSQDVALNKLVNELDKFVDKANLKNDVLDRGNTSIGEDAADMYRVNAKYTGSISMQQVDDGTASGWYALVVLNSDMTRTKYVD